MILPAVITSRRLTLRPFEMQDLEGYVAYYTGPRTGGVGGPRPRHQVVERFMAMAGQWSLRGYGRHAITEGGPAFGHVGIMHLDDVDTPEMTWTLWDADREGAGYATEAAAAVLTAWQGAPLVARIAPGNTASLRMAARLGFSADPEATSPAYAPGMLTFRQGAA
ncbi:GNAT family N-acetyltransferase [Jannaschia sp. 2305UL9-9]|uniref:GNAT family N-acetyltransferase n=1 Tax=Jannaschia sp. 2305UL9-9 TaxID=3121638 RepID=UPI00352995D1